jgi:hypothetical protein
MTRPIQIRREDVVRNIRELAELTHQPLTDVIDAAVANELRRAKRRLTPSQERQRRIDAVLARIDALQRTGDTLTDDDLYDQDGFPR